MFDFIIRRFMAQQKREIDLKRKEEVVGIELTKREEMLKFHERTLDEKITVVDDANRKKMELSIEIAKLEAEAVFKKQLIDAISNNTTRELEITKKAYEAIIVSKDQVIKDLQENVKVLIEKLPEVNLKDLNVNVASPNVHGVNVTK